VVVICIEIPSVLVSRGQSPFYGFEILLPQKKKKFGDAKCPGFQETIKNTKLLRMRRNILTLPWLGKKTFTVL